MRRISTRAAALLALSVACQPAGDQPDVSVTSTSDSNSADNSAGMEPEWEVRATAGVSQFLYMSPAGLADKHFIAQVLHSLVDQSDIAEILFFDDRAFTPIGYPMTDRQLLHWRARFIQNPNSRLVDFAFIEVVDSTASPPDLREIKAAIRPGYAK